MRIKYNIIREVRQNKGYSQEYVAYLLNVSQSHYSKLENGIYSIDFDMLGKILDVLEINLLEIVEFSEKQKFLMNNIMELNYEECVNISGGGFYNSFGILFA
jgi:hypothetical protein